MRQQSLPRVDKSSIPPPRPRLTVSRSVPGSASSRYLDVSYAWPGRVLQVVDPSIVHNRSVPRGP